MMRRELRTWQYAMRYLPSGRRHGPAWITTDHWHASIPRPEGLPQRLRMTLPEALEYVRRWNIAGKGTYHYRLLLTRSPT